jgi:lambda repressor-like predicted transcriptional regulator
MRCMETKHAPPNRLKEVLRKRGHGAQSWLTRELEMGEAQMSKYVNGALEPSYRTKKRIAEALEMGVEELWPIL